MIVLNRLAVSFLILLVCGACGFVTSTNKAVFVLVDVSGTYSKHASDAISSSRVMISKLQTNDWVGFAQISSCSFSDNGLVVREQLPSIPSQAAQVKTRIFEQLNAYGDALQPTSYTDIKGGLRYATNELGQANFDNKFIVIYSDMFEDVAPDCQTQNLEVDLTGVTVIASNVTKTNEDERDPQSYFDRLNLWKDYVESSGGRWVIASTAEQINELVDER